MTPIDLTRLLLSLAYAMGQAATPTATLGDELFVHQAPTTKSDATVASLRVYGGPPTGELRPVPRISVQCMTQAMDAEAGLSLAQRLHASLHDPANSDRPRQTWSIVGKKLDASGDVVNDDTVAAWDIRLIVFPAGGPGIVGRGDAEAGGRLAIPFNFDVLFSNPQ